MKTTSNLSFLELLLIGLFLMSFIGLYFANFFLETLTESNQVLQETQSEYQKIAELALSIDQIAFDTSVLKNRFLTNLNNLPQFPLDTNSPLVFGKQNPFSGNFVLVATTSTGIVGGVRSTAQTFSSTTPITATTSNQTTPRR